MGRKLLIALILFTTGYGAQAQSFSIRGKLQDQETKLPVQGATVVLKSISDSSVVLNTLTDSTGQFLFSNLLKDSFTIRPSAIGYETLTRKIKIDSADVDLGAVIFPKTAKELTGVTVTSTAAAVQKGDTLQISASQYKVNPDATSEDLVRKMPGITVENGQVKANGENVQKVTIDGRELFGDDATAALRNLPAEVVDKIQVFDRLSDQAQFTGFDDGSSTKGINIVTKASMRNGQFGRVFAGYGTDDRYAAGGNTTLLKNNRKISIVGNFNNTNQQNFASQDLLGVTNNGQQGRGGGGFQGGGGGQRGGGAPQGGRGGGGGGFQGGGNTGNFLVGQQTGINKTNALGINYTDNWSPKVIATGSYFFNNTNNTTNQLTSTQYYDEALLDNKQNTFANSRNNNHRVNLRFEYKIDSANQLIFTPNLSFQDNQTDRTVNTLRYDNKGSLVRETDNLSNSKRSGNNLNNSILYRHSFAKRGRTFSINLNQSYNKRDGDTYVQTLDKEYTATGIIDTASQRYTDQKSDGLNLSANLNYTEPLSPNAQLQFSYNPSISKNNSDQQAFGMNPADNKYSLFLDSLSNKFRNTTQAQNGGISYRWGNRDRQISFGVNYQQTDLNSNQTFPRASKVDKTFQNLLPNAQIRYKISPRSSIRLFYRTNTNQPSINQLQSVIDPNNAPFYNVGNPDLNQQYTHNVNSQYTFTNTQKGLLLVGNVNYQQASNYITNATYAISTDTAVYGVTLKRGDQLTKPINVDGYSSFRSFLTFATPLKFIKSNLNLNTGFSYNQLPGFVSNKLTDTKNYTYNLGTVISSNVSQYMDFTISYSANINQVRSNQVASNGEKVADENYFSHTASIQFNLLSKTGWFFQNDLNNQLYSGLEAGFNQNYFLWNMGAGKKFLKSKKAEVRLSVFDLLKQNRSITREVNEIYIQDVQNTVLRQYFMLTFTYNLRNFGTPAARTFNRGGERGEGNFPRF